MTKYIPEQARVSGTFPLSVNGAVTYLRAGRNFEESAAILSALGGAGIEYSDQVYGEGDGTATGRLKVFGTPGSRVLLVINGMAIGHIFANVYFTPTASELNAIQNSNLGYELEYGAIDPNAAAIDDQIFPTPDFDDETGLVEIVGSAAISGGLLDGDDDFIATFTPTKTIVPGVYEVVSESVSLDGQNISISIGGADDVALGGLEGTPLGPNTVIVPVEEVTAQTIVISYAAGSASDLTSVTVTRTE